MFLGQGHLDAETHREEDIVKTWGRQLGREAWSRPFPHGPQEEPPATTLTPDFQLPQWVTTNRGALGNDLQREQGSGDT